MAGGAVGQQGVGSQGMGIGGMGGGMQQPLVSLPAPGSGFGMGSPMQNAMQQPLVSLPPPGSGFGMGQNLQGRMQQPLVSLPAPIRAPNGNFGVPGGMGLGGVGQVQQALGGPPIQMDLSQDAYRKFLAQVNPAQGQALPSYDQWVQLRQGPGPGLIKPSFDPARPPTSPVNPQIKPSEAWFMNNYDADPVMKAKQQEYFANLAGTGGPSAPLSQVSPPNPQIQQPEFYTNYLNYIKEIGQSPLMGNINAGVPGVASTQGGIGSLGPMRSTPTPARPLPPRPGPQVQPIRRPLPMTGLGGLAGLAGMFRGRQ